MKLSVKVQDGKATVIEKANEKGHYTIDGSSKVAEVLALGEKTFLVHNNQTPVEIHVLSFDKEQKKAVMLVNGKKVQLSGEDDMDRLLKQLGMDSGGAKKMKELKAPMPGLVVKIEVKPGDEVQKDQPLVILEAMKMENVLKAVGNATVASVEVKQGQAVEKNQVMIKFS